MEHGKTHPKKSLHLRVDFNVHPVQVNDIDFFCFIRVRVDVQIRSLGCVSRKLRAARARRRPSTYLRNTNHRRSQMFSFASIMICIWPFFVGPSLQTSGQEHSGNTTGVYALSRDDLRRRDQFHRFRKLEAGRALARLDARLVRVCRLLADHDLPARTLADKLEMSCPRAPVHLPRLGGRNASATAQVTS